MRGGRLRLLTRDHSLVQDLIERGEITEAEAATHPESHVVTRAIGGTPSLEAESVSVPLLVGDRVLMCSDGLPRCVYDRTIAAILAQAATPPEACEALVREALEAGAPDNVSVIVIDMGQG
jgi:protein phosphatase